MNIKKDRGAVILGLKLNPKVPKLKNTTEGKIEAIDNNVLSTQWICVNDHSSSITLLKRSKTLFGRGFLIMISKNNLAPSNITLPKITIASQTALNPPTMNSNARKTIKPIILDFNLSHPLTYTLIIVATITILNKKIISI